MRMMLVEEDVAPELIEHEAMLQVYDHTARTALADMGFGGIVKLGQRYVVDGEDGKKSIVWDVLDVRSLA